MTTKEIRKKFIENGDEAISDVELFQMAGLYCPQIDNPLELLKMDFASVQETINDISLACKIMATKVINKRYSMILEEPKPQITSSSSAAKLFYPVLRGLDHEECWVLYLNRANRLIARERLSIGGICSTIMDTRLILKRGLEKLSCAIIIGHNHPSGNANPGEQDRVQTKILKDAASLLDIALLDHIIITENSHYSFSDNKVVLNE